MDVAENFTAKDRIEILDETQPRLDEYATPQEWYQALTNWFIETGLQVQKLPQPARAPARPIHPPSNDWKGNVGRAAYIVGCLTMDGTIHINLDDSISMSNFKDAVATLTRLLDMTEPRQPGEMPICPF